MQIPWESAPLLMVDGLAPVPAPPVWQVGALCRAIAQAIESRFNPVAVLGEVSGFSRAPSGHCYFALKDSQGQLRCAMFKRAASLLEALPRDGDVVQVMGRLGVYEPRGDLQLIVESLRPAGQGALFEQFLQLKAKLQAQGLFDPERKRAVPALPRAIGVVTSLGAAALQDVLTALKRRAPHVEVILSPAAVQGAQAPAELVAALDRLSALGASGRLDVVLLVRGGGSVEDLWAFNDEQLARAIVRCSVPVISGVGHETDFTIADFCADLRAPTPTAAAELAAQPLQAWLQPLAAAQERLDAAVARRVDGAMQRLDQATARLGRPSARLGAQQLRLGRSTDRLRHAVLWRQQAERGRVLASLQALRAAMQRRLERSGQQLGRAGLRLEMLDPGHVLRRGYALLADADGHAVTSARQTHAGQSLVATLADGEVALTVAPRGPFSS